MFIYLVNPACRIFIFKFLNFKLNIEKKIGKKKKGFAFAIKGFKLGLNQEERKQEIGLKKD